MRRSESFGGSVAGIIGFVVIFGFACWFISMQAESEKNTIRAWAKENDYNIVSLDKTLFDHGPFWLVDEDDRIYKVVLIDHQEKRRTTYFWFGIFSHEQRWVD